MNKNDNDPTKWGKDRQTGEFGQDKDKRAKHQTYHPEAATDEVFVGNVSRGDSLAHLDEAGLNYRLGETAYDSMGKKMVKVFAPLLVQVSSLATYNELIEDRRKNWKHRHD